MTELWAGTDYMYNMTAIIRTDIPNTFPNRLQAK